MKKKFGYMIVAIILVVAGVLVVDQFLPRKNANEESKVIHIDIYDKTKKESEDAPLAEFSVESDAETLSELMKEEKKLKAVVEDGEYGSLLTEIYGLKQDMEKGPWLVYDSENNASCLEAGMCPAMDDVVLADGDHFRMELISSFE